MSSTIQIPVPWQVRARLFARQGLQGLLFIASIVAVAWMWTQQAPTLVSVGQVGSMQVRVPASADGVLLSLQEPLAQFDRVQKDTTLIARLDISDLLLQMQTLTAERKRLQAMIVSETERLRLEQQQWNLEDDQRNRDLIRHRLSVQQNTSDAIDQVERLRSEINDIQQRRRQIVLQLTESASSRRTQRVELENLQSKRQRVSMMVNSQMVPSYRLAELEDQIAVKNSMISENDALRTTLEKQSAQINREGQQAVSRLQQSSDRLSSVKSDSDPQSIAQRLTDQRSTETIDIEKSVAHLESAVLVQDAKIRQLAQQIASNEIISPVSGMISQIHHPPGTFVTAGDPVVTIATDHSDWIIAYAEQPFGRQIRVGDSVRVQSRGNRTIVAEARVEELGTQYELMPEHLWRIADVPQIALPVKVALPVELALKPGELVNVVFTTASMGSLSRWFDSMNQ
jgi:multidrug resistance efflux pump